MENVVAIQKTEKSNKPSLLQMMADKAHMDVDLFAKTVRSTVMPKGHTNEQFAALMLVASEYDLNPIVKEIYAFPAKGGGIVPIVSIDGWINLVNSHPKCDGFTFQTERDESGKLVSVTCQMYRKDRSHPVEVTEYLIECKRNTEPWKMENRMLRHKALIQAARYAFGFSGIYDEDEGAKIAEMKNITPEAAEPPLSPPIVPDEEPETPEEKIERAELWFSKCQTLDDLSTAWEQFEDIGLSDVEMLKIQWAYDEQEALISGNVVNA